MSTTTTTLAELPSLKGSVLGTSEWFEITQDRVNTFADATDDHQWIHVDVEEVKGGLQLTVGGVVEREGGDKPVCVLEAVMRFYG